MATRGEAVQAQILELLGASETPLGAYNILARLQETEGKLGPPTVYRALSALVSQGKAHRIESKNAYVACQCVHQGDQHAVLSICDDCGGVEELFDDALTKDLSDLAERAGFRPSRHVLEVHGRCGRCDAAESE